VEDVGRQRALDEFERSDDALAALADDVGTECAAVGTAFFFVSTTALHRSQAASADEVAALDAQEAALLSAVPAELLDEIEVVRAAGAELTERVQEQVTEAAEGRPVAMAEDAESAFEAPEVRRAVDTVERYLRATCDQR
jgi:hypothetical protein